MDLPARVSARRDGYCRAVGPCQRRNHRPGRDRRNGPLSGFVASEQGSLRPEPYEDGTIISITVKLASSSEAMRSKIGGKQIARSIGSLVTRPPGRKRTSRYASPPQNGAGQFPGTPRKPDQRSVRSAASPCCGLVHGVPAGDRWDGGARHAPVGDAGGAHPGDAVRGPPRAGSPVGRRGTARTAGAGPWHDMPKTPAALVGGHGAASTPPRQGRRGWRRL